MSELPRIYGLARYVTLAATLLSGCARDVGSATRQSPRAAAGNGAGVATLARVATAATPMVHGAVLDATDGVTPLAGGQVTPVYDCAGACDASQGVPGADSTQTITLANGAFLFLQTNSRLLGYFITVPGYQALFVPRSFRNPAPPALYRLAADGGIPDAPYDAGAQPQGEPEQDAMPSEPPLEDASVPAADEEQQTVEPVVDAGSAPDQPREADRSVSAQDAGTTGEPPFDAAVPAERPFDAGSETLDPVSETFDAGTWADPDVASHAAWGQTAPAADGGEATISDASSDSGVAADGGKDAGPMLMDTELPPVFLCPEGAPDTDQDGVCDSAEMRYTTDPNNADTDGDFLSDSAELYGYRNADGTLLDLPKLNANPKHRDVFLYVDYYAGLAPADAALDQVIAAFANGAWDNVDGKPGIALHIRKAAKALARADAPNVITSFTQVGKIKSNNFDKKLTYAYHYAIFANRVRSILSSSSGMSPQTEVAADLVVSLGGWKPRGGTPLQQAGTLMHELGHNLGLDHGGYTFVSDTPGGQTKSDTTSFKPHYLSVMNYSYQDQGMTYDGKLVIDYARSPVGAISEQALNEAAGLKPPDTKAQTELAKYTNLRVCTRQARGDCSRYTTIAPTTARGTAAANLDWNRNGKIDPKAVVSDVNGLNGTRDTWKGIAADWPLLKFHGLPRSGPNARFVDLEDEPVRTCMGQPGADDVQEEP